MNQVERIFQFLLVACVSSAEEKKNPNHNIDTHHPIAPIPNFHTGLIHLLPLGRAFKEVCEKFHECNSEL